MSTGRFQWPIMTKEEYADVVKTRYAGREHFHCMTLDSGLVVDGGTFGGEARFINHNCDPNCEIQKWNVLGCWRIGIFAKRDIAVGVSRIVPNEPSNIEEQKACSNRDHL